MENIQDAILTYLKMEKREIKNTKIKEVEIAFAWFLCFLRIFLANEPSMFFKKSVFGLLAEVSMREWQTAQEK